MPTPKSASQSGENRSPFAVQRRANDLNSSPPTEN
jgi:hypothetical protein